MTLLARPVADLAVAFTFLVAYASQVVVENRFLLWKARFVPSRT